MRKKWDKNNIYQDKDYQLSKPDKRRYATNLRSPIIIRKFREGRKEGRIEGQREGEEGRSNFSTKHIIVKFPKAKDKENTLKAARKRCITFK